MVQINLDLLYISMVHYCAVGVALAGKIGKLMFLGAKQNGSLPLSGHPVLLTP